MRIGVISDTHGMVDRVGEALSKMGQIDLLIHLGDHYDDLIFIRDLLDIEVIGVKGNCDQEADAKEEVVINIRDHKLLLVHGHRYGVKESLTRLYYRALELECDIALFGHTHIPINLKEDHMLLINPGSLSIPKGGSQASCGIIEILKDKIHSEIINL